MVPLVLGVVFALKVFRGKRRVFNLSTRRPAEDEHAAEGNLAKSNQAELKASSPCVLRPSSLESGLQLGFCFGRLVVAMN
jgi:hypothetical protein